MTPKQNEMLCRVEGRAPMGKLMRQHWLPACMIEEVAEPDCAPVRARLLGVDLVVFRDTQGRLGVLDEHCPHRRASLAFGRNEQCGLRCLYHGWKFDVNGTAVEVPSESLTARSQARRGARAYPVVESGGIVWVWLDDAPPAAFDPPTWAPSATTKISIVKMHAECNWAQVLEGAIDSAHSSSLHATNMPTAATVSSSTATQDAWLRPSDDKAPRIEVDVTPFGFRYAAIRKPLVSPATQDYVRTTLFIAPFTVLIPPNDQYNLAQMLVPIDDVSCMFYWIAWHETKGIAQADWRRFCAAVVGEDIDSNFRKLRNIRNRYMQDRAAMKAGDFTGIRGIPTQDMAMWESMGAIANRSREHLGMSDRAVIQFRKQMLAAAQAVANGEDAIGTQEPRIPRVQLASFEGMVPKSADWRAVSIGDYERRIRSDIQARGEPREEGAA